MKGSFKLQGFREMDAALAEFPKATAGNILRRTAVEALGPVADAMQAKAPRAEGDLALAIDVGTKRAKRTKKHFPESSTIEAYAGVKVVGGGMPPQAIQQEFGNENHGPQPFARPGWDREAAPTLERVKDSLGQQIDKARVRAQRKALRAKRA